MKITTATNNDIEFLAKYDYHISLQELENSISMARILVADADGISVGWLRYGLFWDNLPFMNLLFVLDPYRCRGIGKALVSEWEGRMKSAGYSMVLTSTLSNETSQHFYRKLGYIDTGSLLLPEEPSLEIILRKTLV